MTRILYIANIRLPTEKAHGLQIMKTCEAFEGAEVELVIPTRHNPINEDPFSYYSVDKKFTITTLQVPDWIRFGRIGFFLSALWFAEKARWLRQFWEADIVYSRDALILLQYILLGRKLVFEAHGPPTFVSKIVAKQAYRVILISHGLYDAYERAGVSREKMLVAPDAVDTRLFDHIPSRTLCRKELKIPEDQKVALYVGHLYPRKGADTLAQAVSRLDSVHVGFVGGTDSDIANFKARYATQPAVKIIGRVPHNRVPLYLRAADVLVLPNSGKDPDSSRFTSPMKLFEYMASLTPIVASEVPAIKEVLSDESCFFVAPDDAQALANGIQAVFADTAAADRKAERARELVALYSWTARSRSILAFISSPESLKNNDFFNTESIKYSRKRYPEVPVTFTQYFFKARLSITLEFLARARLGEGKKSVLEVGCADGVVAGAIWERFATSITHFDANDSAPEMIDAAKRAHTNIPVNFFVRTSVPPTHAYDAIVEVGVLNYTDTAVDFAQAAAGLTAHGVYICSVAGSSSLQARLKGTVGYEHVRSYGEYEQELGKYFRVIHERAVGFFIPYLWKVPALGRATQPVIEWVGRYLAPSLALEKVYLLTPLHHDTHP